jgi:hypothetical protein
MAKKKQLGGKRKGAGRKVGEEGPSVIVTASVPSDLVTVFDAYADSKGWGRSKAVTEAIRSLLKRKARG